MRVNFTARWDERLVSVCKCIHSKFVTIQGTWESALWGLLRTENTGKIFQLDENEIDSLLT